MKTNKHITPFTFSPEEMEEIELISHRHDPDRGVSGVLRLRNPHPVSDIIVGDSNSDFMLDLESGRAGSDIEPNSDYQCSGTDMIPESGSETFGLQFISTLDAADPNFCPNSFADVQSRLGLDKNFDPMPVADIAPDA